MRGCCRSTPVVLHQAPHLDLDEPVLAACVDREIALLATLRRIRDGEFDPGIAGGPGRTHLIQYQPHGLRLGVGADAGLEDLLGSLVAGVYPCGEGRRDNRPRGVRLRRAWAATGFAGPGGGRSGDKGVAVEGPRTAVPSTGPCILLCSSIRNR